MKEKRVCKSNRCYFLNIILAGLFFIDSAGAGFNNQFDLYKFVCRSAIATQHYFDYIDAGATAYYAALIVLPQLLKFDHLLSVVVNIPDC